MYLIFKILHRRRWRRTSMTLLTRHDKGRRRQKRPKLLRHSMYGHGCALWMMPRRLHRSFEPWKLWCGLKCTSCRQAAFPHACTYAGVHRRSPSLLGLAQANASRSDSSRHVQNEMPEYSLMQTSYLLRQVFDAALERDVTERLLDSAFGAICDGWAREWYADIRHDGALHKIELSEHSTPNTWFLEFDSEKEVPELTSSCRFGRRPPRRSSGPP